MPEPETCEGCPYYTHWDDGGYSYRTHHHQCWIERKRSDGRDGHKAPIACGRKPKVAHPRGEP